MQFKDQNMQFQNLTTSEHVFNKVCSKLRTLRLCYGLQRYNNHGLAKIGPNVPDFNEERTGT
jgi:hypothetical protein